MNRSRSRSYSRKEKAPRKDAVLSAMLAQITVCLLLLALAYSLKLSGLPAYHTMRADAQRLLSEELSWGPFAQMLQRLDLRMPVWLPGGKGETEPGVEQETSSAQEPPAQEQEETSSSPEASALDDELAGYIAQYLPQEEGSLSAMAGGDEAPPNDQADEGGGKTPVPPTALPSLEDSLGRGGGITPVRFSTGLGDKGRLVAPAGVLLSPFFITNSPILPVKLSTLTSNFGFREHPITGEPDFHTGTDLAAPAGTRIAAVLPGTVSEVGVSPFYGNFIVLSHGAGLETLYGHCSEILAPPGAVIRQRESIARVGSTGMSTGNHVHLEFRVAGQKANPAWVYDEF